MCSASTIPSMERSGPTSAISGSLSMASSMWASLPSLPPASSAQRYSRRSVISPKRLAISGQVNRNCSKPQGKPRIRMRVAPDGAPKLEFLDEATKVIYSLRRGRRDCGQTSRWSGTRQGKDRHCTDATNEDQMKTLKAIILLLSCFLLVSSQGSLYAQKKVGALTFETVRPTAGNGQEIIYKDKSNQEVKVEYGTLVVPERHDKPNGNTIELAFFRLKSVSPNPGSPIVFLEGGPGLPGTNAYYGPVMELLIPLREAGDVIILDQRGTGHTKPRMTCPNKPNTVSEQAATYQAMLNDSRERSRKCAESLRSQGIDLSAYNMNESADDLEDLRKALGAKKISLLGFSGGATLALATLRRHGPNLDRNMN